MIKADNMVIILQFSNKEKNYNQKKNSNLRTDRISRYFDNILKVKFFVVDVHFQQIVFDSVLVVRIKV